MPKEKIKKLAIIAGSGYLPKHVYDACQHNGIKCELIILEGETSPELFNDAKNIKFKAHKISQILRYIRKIGATHLTLAGKVKRANISKLLLDLKGAKLFAMIIKKGLNDNAILKTILEFIEEEGLKIIAPEKVAPSIILHKGPLSKAKPNTSAKEDIKLGLKILKGIASYDVGQALIMQHGLVLGVEAAEGTDELIKRCGEIKQNGEGPILIKIVKPEQDKRIDLPCIGPDTILMAHKYGIRGIAAEAGSTLILDQSNTLKLADKLKIFIFGF
jgi:DUF1009 family protein